MTDARAVTEWQPVEAGYPAFDGRQACTGVEASVMFPARPGDPVPSEVRVMCSGCVFLEGCLGYALAYDVDGVWAGTNVADRVELRRRHGVLVAHIVGVEQSTTTGEEIDLLRASGMSVVQIAQRLEVTTAVVEKYLRDGISSVRDTTGRTA